MVSAMAGLASGEQKSINVFNAHRLVYHSTLGLRVIKKKKEKSINHALSLQGVDRGPSLPDREWVDIAGLRASCAWSVSNLISKHL